ncbi:exosome complex component RRP46-like [Watersipora subatra]|uniref:exosome complex component RRP46-like n=1 Tax=Watersipora subatra TaxID=2589382 RepID=UPI00355ADC14
MDVCFGYLKNADGSAKFTYGNTSTIACVSGPDQVSQQKEIIDRATILVQYKSKSGNSNCSDRAMEHFITMVCDRMIFTSMHPRTSILINILELHDDGCICACAVNATMLALIDAGISMRHMVAAATSCLDENGCIHINPCKELLEHSEGKMTLVIESETYQILSLSSTGNFTSEKLNESILLLTSKCSELLQSFRASVSKLFHQ